VIDPAPVLAAVVRDVLEGVDAGAIGGSVHRAVADVMVAIAIGGQGGIRTGHRRTVGRGVREPVVAVGK